MRVTLLVKDQEQIAFARRLRREQTVAERVLWAKLRSNQLEAVKFRRQQPIGPYIVDFVSFERELVVEIDGGQHDGAERREIDRNRTNCLQEKGYRILRFWNNEVTTNISGVLEKIRETLSNIPLLPSP